MVLMKPAERSDDKILPLAKFKLAPTEDTKSPIVWILIADRIEQPGVDSLVPYRDIFKAVCLQDICVPLAPSHDLVEVVFFLRCTFSQFGVFKHGDRVPSYGCAHAHAMLELIASAIKDGEIYDEGLIRELFVEVQYGVPALFRLVEEISARSIQVQLARR